MNKTNDLGQTVSIVLGALLMVYFGGFLEMAIWGTNSTGVVANIVKGGIGGVVAAVLYGLIVARRKSK